MTSSENMRSDDKEESDDEDGVRRTHSEAHSCKDVGLR